MKQASCEVRVRSLPGALARLQSADAIRIVLGLLLLVVGAQIRVPLFGTPVPGTLQLLAVLIVGLAMRPSCAVASVGAYLVLGTLGLPVFAAGSVGFLGVTGGYLGGFFAGAWVCSLLSARSHASWWRLALSALVGAFIVMLCGAAWIVVWLGGDWETAVRIAGAPFVLKAVVESLLAATIVLGYDKAAHKKRCRHIGDLGSR